MAIIGTAKIDGWMITTESGYGKLPGCRPMTFFCVTPPRLKTETRVDMDGLMLILPKTVYKKYVTEEAENVTV